MVNNYQQRAGVTSQGYFIPGGRPGGGTQALPTQPGGAQIVYGQPVAQQMLPAPAYERYIPPAIKPAQTCHCPDCAGTLPANHVNYNVQSAGGSAPRLP